MVAPLAKNEWFPPGQMLAEFTDKERFGFAMMEKVVIAVSIQVPLAPTSVTVASAFRFVLADETG